VPSRCELACELRELLNKRTFSGDSALNERKGNILQYVIHCIYEDVRRAYEGVCAPRVREV
jgi:hypothetical protein